MNELYVPIMLHILAIVLTIAIPNQVSNDPSVQVIQGQWILKTQDQDSPSFPNFKSVFNKKYIEPGYSRAQYFFVSVL